MDGSSLPLVILLISAAGPGPSFGILDDRCAAGPADEGARMPLGPYMASCRAGFGDDVGAMSWFSSYFDDPRSLGLKH